MGFNFFPIPEHRVFKYTPRYYDENKERMKKLYEKYGKRYHSGENIIEEGASSSSEYRPGVSIKGSFKESREVSRRSAENTQVRRVFVMITLLAAAVVAFYLSQGLAELFLNL